MNAIRHFLSNDSAFGRIMGRLGNIILANLLFVVCCLPVVTIGAGWTAVHYTMLKTLREREIKVLSTFWNSFKRNFKQATVTWMVMLALAAVLLLEMFWCGQFPAPIHYFRYALLALLVAETVLGIYFFPVLAAFEGTVRDLLRFSLYFAIRRPLSMLLLLVLHVVPLAITYLDASLLPLYAFIWAFFGFATVAILSDFFLYRQFKPYQPEDAVNEELEEEKRLEEKKDQTLEDMKRLGL